MNSINYEQRLVDTYNFINMICIDVGTGYDLKEISQRIILGKINYDEAINEWQRRGHSLL